GIAGGVRVAVESFEDQDCPEHQDDEGDADADQGFLGHPWNGNPGAGIVMSMAAFFGFHMPSFTFAGVPNDKLFDRLVEHAKLAERAGFDLVTVMDHLYQIRGIGPATEPNMEA